VFNNVIKLVTVDFDLEEEHKTIFFVAFRRSGITPEMATRGTIVDIAVK
jgi:hypothetical protein